MASNAGRPKSSGVWEYFSYNKETDKSLCLVVRPSSQPDEAAAICGKEFKGSYPTNLKKHIKLCHHDVFQALEAAELERKKKMESKKKSTLSQSFLLMSFSFSKQYDQNSKKHKDITHRLAVFVGASNVALSLVDNVEFRELLVELDLRYKVPHRKKLDSEIQCVY